MRYVPQWQSGLLSFIILSAFSITCFAENSDNGKGDMKDEHEQSYKYKSQKTNNKKDKPEAKAIQNHIKNLNDPDPEIRATSAEMLGYMGAINAIPPLIDVLRPDRNEKLKVMLAVHGALVRITGKNFGYKEYDEWMGWWSRNKEEFLKKAETGVDEKAKIAATSSNTVGLELMKRGEFRSAQGQFVEAINKDPAVPDYRNNMGLSLMEQGRYLDAMEYFEETTGIDADLPQPYMNIGRCYSRMGKSIEAQSYYKKALEKDKEGKLWELSWMIGKEYMKRSEWQLAIEYLDQAHAKAEKVRFRDPRLYNDRAITHYGLDQYHSAWKSLMDVRTLGYEPNPGFVEKVRKALLDQGVDPEAEDRLAREVLRGSTEESVEKPTEKTSQ